MSGELVVGYEAARSFSVLIYCVPPASVAEAELKVFVVSRTNSRAHENGVGWHDEQRTVVPPSFAYDPDIRILL